MSNQTTTVEAIAQAIADNAKSGKWLSCTFQVAHPQAVGGMVPIGVKAFGKWVQRLQCYTVCDSIPEQKTLKALKFEVITAINGILYSLGLPAQVEAKPAAKVVELCERVRLRDNVSTFHVVESGKLREVGETRYRQLELTAERTDTLYSTSDKQFRMKYKTVHTR